MCYDISFKVNIAELADYFPETLWDQQIGINFDASLHIMAHGYPLHPILYRNREDKRVHGRLMEWGVIPFYVKDELLFARQRASMLNARSERILQDPKSYWFKIRHRRCLIPVTGFFEHREVAGFRNKIPYFIQLKEQPVFFIPGLYSVTELPDHSTGEIQPRWTFTLVTREANLLMREIHNSGIHSGRMPLLLTLALSKKWLDEELDPESYQQLLDYAMPPEAFQYRTVWSIRTNKNRPDGLDKTASYSWKGLPELVV